MHEIVLNVHMHTRYSDGSGLHEDLARAALHTGVDALIVTDHNVLVAGAEAIYKEGEKRVLLLVGEEIHDQSRVPQKNHLLVFGAEREMATFAKDPQQLIERVREAGGLSFLAHPVDPFQPSIGEADISWVAWDVQGYTGIELWNGFSEFKGVLNTKLHAVFYAYFPAFVARSPFPETLSRWDSLLAEGKRVVAIGGSDAHAIHASLGPLHRVVFPYEYHFRAINNHLLLEKPLEGKLQPDKRLIYDALRAGHLYIGYDLPKSTRGFRFTAQGKEGFAIMGDSIPAKGGVTLQARCPDAAEILLIKDGKILQTCKNRETCTYITSETGVYRIEVYRRYLGRRRGWIFSNPIYLI